MTGPESRPSITWVGEPAKEYVRQRTRLVGGPRYKSGFRWCFAEAHRRAIRENRNENGPKRLLCASDSFWGPAVGLGRAGTDHRRGVLSGPRHRSRSLLVPSWYREAFGFVPVADRQEGGVRVVLLARRYDAIELRAAEDATGSLRAAGESVEIIVENVDKLVHRLTQAGAVIEREPRDDEHGSYRVAIVRDPEGHALELREPLDDRLRTRRGRRP
jgi:catechol 2,3-dioxygenase-like lactoylglutathione lyase family enzyme